MNLREVNRMNLREYAESILCHTVGEPFTRDMVQDAYACILNNSIWKLVDTVTLLIASI